MSWISCYGASKQEVVNTLLSAAHGRTIAHLLRGCTLWAVKQRSSEPYIACFLLAPENTVAWGYQELREGPHTPCNCPMGFLNLAPPANAAWRDLVKRYQERHLKNPQVGETWALKHARVPHVLITGTHPRLEGMFEGHLRRVARSQLAFRLRTARTADRSGPIVTRGERIAP